MDSPSARKGVNLGFPQQEQSDTQVTWNDIYYTPLSQTWGTPPWNIFMMVNILPSCENMSSKRTEIRIHSCPATIESVQNALYPTKNQIWKVIMIMGPFYDAKETLDLFNEWSSRSRGCKSRISIGINLFKTHRLKKNLVLYITNKKRSELILSEIDHSGKKGLETENENGKPNQNKSAVIHGDYTNPIWSWNSSPLLKTNGEHLPKSTSTGKGDRFANITLEWINMQTNISAGACVLYDDEEDTKDLIESYEDSS
jgi:hypothetical protein